MEDSELPLRKPLNEDKKLTTSVPSYNSISIARPQLDYSAGPYHSAIQAPEEDVAGETHSRPDETKVIMWFCCSVVLLCFLASYLCTFADDD